MEINNLPNQSQILKSITNLQCTVILTGLRYSSKLFPLDACNKVIILDFNLSMLHERKLTLIDWTKGENVSEFKRFVKFMETGRKLNSLWLQSRRNKQLLGNFKLTLSKQMRMLVQPNRELRQRLEDSKHVHEKLMHEISDIDREIHELNDSEGPPNSEEKKLYLKTTRTI